MTTLLLVIHILVSLFLIFVVLVQGGKGAELGAAFGGSSNTLFGARGAATFLSKLTTITAVVFMLTSLLLAVASVRVSTVVKQPIAPKAQTAPQAPAQAPAQGQPAPAQEPLPAPLPIAPGK